MAQGRELLLSEQEQLEFTLELQNRGMFGIAEDPNDFITLKSERVSPHYLDMRKGVSSKSFRELVAFNMGSLAFQRVVDHAFDYPHEAYANVAGTPEAMTSYAVNIADELGVSLLQPRVDMAKTTGNKTPILGQYESGANVAAFDDVVTDGQSKIDTIGGLRKAGLTVLDYYVVVDREEGGAPQVKEQTDVEITPALSLSNMTIMLFAEGRISQTQYDNVVEYMTEYGDPVAQEALGIN